MGELTRLRLRSGVRFELDVRNPAEPPAEGGVRKETARGGAPGACLLVKRDIIGIGGSAGGLAAIRTILQGLPADASAAVLVTLHMSTHGRRYLSEAIAPACALPVQDAEDGIEIQPGRVYLAVPDRHLLAADGRLILGGGPRENMSRPAIYPMLRSLAVAYGPRAIGVVVSGMLDDGASGLCAVKTCGGLAVVQAPEDAQVPDMPRAALNAAGPDHVLPAAAMGALLARLTGTAAEPPPHCPPAVRAEVEIALGRRLGAEVLREHAHPAEFTCPNCHGVLAEMKDAPPVRYRCQTGHALTAATLEAAQEDAVEEALRVALRVMQERRALVERLARDAREKGRHVAAELYEARLGEYARHVETLRAAVLAGLDMVANDDAQRARAQDAGATRGNV